MRNEKAEVICTTCPKGCRVAVWAADGEIQMKGAGCKRGRGYVAQEYRDPRRVLTSTVAVRGAARKRLPVRTATAVPKQDLMMCMERLSGVTVAPPVAIGDVIVQNISAGIDLVASDNLQA